MQVLKAKLHSDYFCTFYVNIKDKFLTRSNGNMIDILYMQLNEYDT